MRKIHAHKTRAQAKSTVKNHAVLNLEKSAKKPTNLSLSVNTLEMAREMGMNLSQTVDTLLTVEVKRRYWEQWNERNKDAIDAYNERIAVEGLPLAEYRSF